MNYTLSIYTGSTMPEPGTAPVSTRRFYDIETAARAAYEAIFAAGGYMQADWSDLIDGCYYVTAGRVFVVSGYGAFGAKVRKCGL